jgi:hypothetical protein
LGELVNDPSNPFTQGPRMGDVLAGFALTTATGVLGLGAGAFTFGAMQAGGFGLISSGAAAGFIGDFTTQTGDLGVNWLTGGSYGRSSYSGTELALSAGFGAAPGVAVAVKEGVDAFGNAISQNLRTTLAPYTVPSTRAVVSDVAAQGGGDVDMLTSLDVQGIRAQRVLIGDNGKVAVIGRSMGDFTQRGEFGVVDFTRVLRNDLGFDTELFAGKQIQPEWFQEVQALREIHGVDILPDEVIKTTEIYKQNMLWAQKLVDQGYTVVDIGNPGFRGASPFYDGESSTVFNSGTASKTIDVSNINGYKPHGNP